jgi:hypothetical protein
MVTGLDSLEKHADEARSLLPNQVFIPEQQVYNKGELDRHLKSGDVSGPLAESGFKGHPQCRFCRRRFYGDNELFLHMQARRAAWCMLAMGVLCLSACRAACPISEAAAGKLLTAGPACQSMQASRSQDCHARRGMLM